jgi:hypothetical protein
MNLKRKDKKWLGKKKEEKKGKPNVLREPKNDVVEFCDLKRKFDQLSVQDEFGPSSFKKLKLKSGPFEEQPFDSDSIESEIEEIGLFSGRTNRDDSVVNTNDEYLDNDEPFRSENEEEVKTITVRDFCLPGRDWYRPSPPPRWLRSFEYVFIYLSFCANFLEIRRKLLFAT